MSQKALDEIVESIDTFIDGVEQNSFDDNLETAELANMFLTDALEQIPENDTERNVFNHYYQDFVNDNPLPDFVDDLDANTEMITQYLENLLMFFSEIRFMSSRTLKDISNKRRRDDDDDEEEEQQPPPSKEAKTNVGLGRYVRFGGANYFG